MISDDIIEEDIQQFLKIHVENSEKDLILLLANSMRYAENAPQPIQGFGDNISLMVKFISEQVDEVKKYICDEYCGNSIYTEGMRGSSEAAKILILAKIINAVLGGDHENVTLGALNKDMLIIFSTIMNYAVSSIENLCDCTH